MFFWRTEDDDDDDEDERVVSGRDYDRILLSVFLLIVVECFENVVEDDDDLEDGDDIDGSATCTLWVLCVVVWVTLKLDIPCG